MDNKTALKVKGKISVFKNDDDESVKYLDIFTEVPVFDKIIKIKLKPDSATSKMILGKALGLSLTAETSAGKTVDLKGEVQKFKNEKGQPVKFISYFVEVPFEGDVLKVKINPPDATAKSLLALCMGLSLTADIAEADGDLPF